MDVMLSLAERLGIKAEIVLNKANVGKRRLIEKVSKKFRSVLRRNRSKSIGTKSFAGLFLPRVFL